MFSSHAKVQAVVLAIVLEAGGEWTGKTTLAKAVWWAHLASLRDRGAVISGHKIVRLPYGPAPNDFDEVLHSLDLLTETVDEDDAFPTRTYTVADSAKASSFVADHLDDGEMVCVREAAAKFQQMTATEASEWAHRNSSAWRETSDGQAINVGRDLVDDEAFEAGRAARRASEDELGRMFGPKSDRP